MHAALSFRHVLPWIVSLLAMAVAPYCLAQEPAQAVIDPPGRVARLSHIEGEVSLMPAQPVRQSGSEAPDAAEADSPWVAAALNRPLTSGDNLWLGNDARAQLQTGSADIYLDHETAFGFIALDDDTMQMSLTGGGATIRVRRLAERETIQVETPNASILVRRPGEYHVRVDPAGDRTLLKTRSGEAQVVAGEGSHTVGAEQAATFSGLDGTVSLAAIAPRDEFESWANERDQRAERSQSARYVSNDVIGYEDLDDNGEWVSEPGYGHVWRPLHVASDWAPYRYGQWSWISPWGWTWIDDARWGFAPFHYGRWAQLRQRWYWVPGPRHLRPVYAPALVGWTGAPSLNVSLAFGGGVGWFPLAPYEIYRPWYRHTPRYVRHVNNSNTLIIHRTRMTDLYTPRQPQDYRYGRQSGAVTIVHRDRFSNGRPIGPERIRANDRDLRQWRAEGRPPAFIADRHRTPGVRPPAGTRADRNPVHGDNPKRGGDFRASRPVPRPQAAAASLQRATPVAPERRLQTAPRTPAGSRQQAGPAARERLEIMRARPAAGAQSSTRRPPPATALRQGTDRGTVQGIGQSAGQSASQSIRQRAARSDAAQGAARRDGQARPPAGSSPSLRSAPGVDRPRAATPRAQRPPAGTYGSPRQSSAPRQQASPRQNQLSRPEQGQRMTPNRASSSSSAHSTRPTRPALREQKK